MYRTFVAVLFALATALPAGAAEDGGADRIRATLHERFPKIVVDEVNPAPLAGFYEVIIGSEVFYVSADAKYLMQGTLMDLESRRDLTEERTSGLRLKALDRAGEEQMIIFEPKQAKHTITVFTDIDCGYCRKLHSEIDQFMAEGVRVRYMFYPRAGVGSDSYNKAVAVWCAEDHHKALTDAKQGLPVEQKGCDNPVKDQFALGERLGIRGTPAIITESGEMLPGYVPAKRLAQMLEGAKVRN